MAPTHAELQKVLPLLLDEMLENFANEKFVPELGRLHRFARYSLVVVPWCR
jgi:hypothetical protein